MEMKRERNRWFLFGGIVVIFSILYGSMLFINKSTDNLISSRENRIEEVISETESLKKAGINLSKKDIQSLFTIESERILWAKKLQLLSKTTPSDMAITGLTYRNNRFIISAISRISGEEKEFSVVENFAIQFTQLASHLLVAKGQLAKLPPCCSQLFSTLWVTGQLTNGSCQGFDTLRSQ